MVERTSPNRVVVGSIPTGGNVLWSGTLNNGLNAPVAQSVERVAVKPPAGWWTKSVAYARVRVPSGAVLGPGRKIMGPGWGFLIQSFYFIEIII